MPIIEGTVRDTVNFHFRCEIGQNFQFFDLLVKKVKDQDTVEELWAISAVTNDFSN